MAKDKKRRNPSRDRFIFGEPLSFTEPIVAVEAHAGLVAEPFSAFRENLQSAVQVGSIPFQLVHSSVLQQRFNQLHIAERIRAQANVESEPEAEKRALHTARQEMDTELRDQGIVSEHAQNTLNTLDAHLRDEDFSNSSDELLRQVIVMVWGAFETLINDGIRAVLNSNPGKSLTTFNDKKYRDAIFGKSIIDELQKRNFDLSKNMGDIIVENIRVDSLEKIQNICGYILDDANLNYILKDAELWKLSQRRHLIVHRRGVVDSRYISKTGDNRTLGERLKLAAEDIEASLTIVRDAGIAFVKAASA